MRGIFSLQPFGPTTVHDLLPQPHQSNESEERAHDDHDTRKRILNKIIGGQNIQKMREERVEVVREQGSIYAAGSEGYDSQPGESHQGVMAPVLGGGGNGGYQTSGHVAQGQAPRHVGRVNRHEREPVAAKLAELFARVPHPLHETFLVDPLDAAGADARVEEGPLRLGLGAAHPANVSPAAACASAPAVVHRGEEDCDPPGAVFEPHERTDVRRQSPLTDRADLPTGGPPARNAGLKMATKRRRRIDFSIFLFGDLLNFYRNQIDPKIDNFRIFARLREMFKIFHFSELYNLQLSLRKVGKEVKKEMK